MPPNKSLLRTGGQWQLACKSPFVFDKVLVNQLGEPPGAELSRYFDAPRRSTQLG